MLSYDQPVPVNGQAPSAPENTPAAPASVVAMATPQTAYPVDETVSTGSQHRPNGQTGSQHQIWLVTGPAGSGKSTVAKYLASSLNYSYVEGDEFHPPANIEKMSAGIPLADADRWDWLTALREESVRRIAEGGSGVVLTCSALKRKYRDVIRVAPYFHAGVRLHFIYLRATEEMLLQRVAARENHYMGANMVRSQFAALEPPMPDETDVVSVDVARPMDEVLGDALAKVLQTLASTKEVA